MNDGIDFNELARAAQAHNPAVQAAVRGTINSNNDQAAATLPFVPRSAMPYVNEGVYLGSTLGSLASGPMAIPMYAGMGVDAARSGNDAVQLARFLHDPRQVSLERHNPRSGTDALGWVPSYTAAKATSSTNEYVNNLSPQEHTAFKRDWEDKHGINYDSGKFLWQDPSPRLPQYINNRDSFGPGRNVSLTNPPAVKAQPSHKPASNLPRL